MLPGAEDNAPRSYHPTRAQYDTIRYLPMLVGAISPISILLSIPPLTGPWKSLSYIDERKFAKTPLVTASISVALFFLLMANVFLLCRFLEKRIVLFTFLAIFCYCAHASFLLGPLIDYVIRFPTQKEEKLTGDYAAGIATSIFSTLAALLLIIDYFKNDKLRMKGSGVSSKQRNLVFFIIITTLWSAIGAFIFSYFEGWSFTKGIYFTLVTMTTIGFGDIVPKLTGTRIFLFFYAIVGIVAMGILINCIRIVILEGFEEYYIQKLEQYRLDEIDLFVNKSNKSNKEEKAQFKQRRNLLEEQKDLQLTRQLQFSILALIIFWILGAVIFMFAEEWSYFDALYFCFVTFTTIGYGDITVQSFYGTVIFIAYSLLGLVAAAYLISVATERWSRVLEKRATKIDTKHKAKINLSEENNKIALDQHDEMAVNNILSSLDPDEDVDTEDPEILRQIISVSKLYYYQVQKYISQVDIESPEDRQGNHRERMDKYNELFQHLIAAVEAKVNENHRRSLIFKELADNAVVNEFDDMDRAASPRSESELLDMTR